jgi:hypothetical protein
MEDCALWDKVFRDLRRRLATPAWNAQTSPLMREFRQHPSLRKVQRNSNTVVNNNIGMLCDAAMCPSRLPDFCCHSSDESIEVHGVWFQSAMQHDNAVYGQAKGWWQMGGFDHDSEAHEFAKSMSNATGRDFQVWHNSFDLLCCQLRR